MAKLEELRKELKKVANSKKAKILQRFFKTGKGEYGEGDIFLGVQVPMQRKLVAKYQNLTLSDVLKLLKSKIHEERLVGLIVLVRRYSQGQQKDKERIFRFYIKSTRFINNWDLVDTSAPLIVGSYLINRPKSILFKFARSKNIWERRIAMIASYYFIRQSKFDDALRIAEILLTDKHDLIHKAVGWMLRETGNRSLAVELKFLDKYYKQMPRTMLRYAIEKFPKKLREKYMV